MKQTTLFVVLLLLASSAWCETIAVRAQPLSDLLRQPEFSVPASVRPLNAPSLAAEISGRVESIPVRVGDQVAAGTVLVKLDCRYHQSRLQANKAQLKRIEAQLSFANTQLERNQALNKKKTISDEVLDQSRTNLLSAQADLEDQREQIRQAEIDVERCVITSPFDAIVTARLAHEGGLASPGTPLLNVVQLSDPEVSAELSSAEAASLENAQALRFSYDVSNYALQLQHLLPVVDERTRTREARLVFKQAAAPIGAAGRLVWQGRSDELPADYLVRRDQRLGIFLVEGGIARFHALADAREGQPVRIDVDPEKLLVTDGRQRLQDGDTIEVLK